ncbi:MAG: MIP/aquaporin family protein [Sporolactobacillus sp.]
MAATLMTRYLAELVGTFIMILLGDGAVANVFLKKGKAGSSGWLGISLGWATAVAVPVWIFGGISGAHFNPSVTLGLAVIGKFPVSEVLPYLGAQFIGAFLGAVAVFVIFYKQFQATDDTEAKLGTFTTIPAVRSYFLNFVGVFIEAFILVFTITATTTMHLASGMMGLIVFVVIFVIVFTIGGTTGCPLNAARDLAPRIAHALLPVPGKGTSDWRYAWIPVVGTALGGICGAVLYVSIF